MIGIAKVKIDSFFGCWSVSFLWRVTPPHHRPHSADPDLVGISADFAE